MRSNFQLLLLFCFIGIRAYSQNELPPSLNIGDPAPPLYLREWIKAEPVQKFEKGKLYVIEFWATWCRPCRAAMPHLSALANKYKDKVIVVGIDIYEEQMKNSSPGKVRAFVDSMGLQMDYRVAAGDSNMVAAWINAAGEERKGIPRTFVVDAEGRLAWIGHPGELDNVLFKMVNNAWDINEALAKRNVEKYIQKLDEDAYYEFFRYRGKAENPCDFGKPDSSLVLISELVKKEPLLKYALHVAYETFSSLLKTNPQKALEYGKELMQSPLTFGEPGYSIISSTIEWYSDKLNLPADIYLLGAAAQQAEIDQFHYTELLNLPRRYDTMAEWYWRANDKSKAIETQQKAIEALQSKKYMSKSDITVLESKLKQYRQG